jgi:hypothetical protein
MNYDDRQFIMSQLSAGKKKESVAHDLLMRRALEEVESVEKDVAQTEARQQWSREQSYYTLLGPTPAPVKIKEEKGQELWQQPGRQQYKVRLMNFAAFCKEIGLPLTKMQEMVEGKHRDVQGWSCIWTGGSFDTGRAWMDPTPQLRTEESMRAVAKAEPPTRRVMSVYTPTAPVIDWKPTQK